MEFEDIGSRSPASLTVPPPVLPILSAVAHNSWGKLGHASLVAQLKSQADGTFHVDSSQHYAQLWMGDHSSHETKVILPGDEETQKTMRLRDWLDLHPEQLGIPASREVDGNRHLSFLLKVLSIKSPLALQIHPDKEMAQWLHDKVPDVFDANHKPEMAVALTPFVALIGFRPVTQVTEFLADIEEFHEALGVEVSQQLREASEAMIKGEGSGEKLQAEALKAAFVRLINPKDAAVVHALQKLVNRIKNDTRMMSVPEYKTILEIDAEFPGDPGALTVFLLNLVHLKPGQAVFIDALIPHAYISGDCIECQASSDNVLRAAFTNKRRDVDLMCSTMTFAPLPTSRIMIAPEIQYTPTLKTSRYPSSCKDFALAKYEVAEDSSTVCIPSLPVASICIITQGQGHLCWFNTNNTPITDKEIRKPAKTDSLHDYVENVHDVSSAKHLNGYTKTRSSGFINDKSCCVDYKDGRNVTICDLVKDTDCSTNCEIKNGSFKTGREKHTILNEKQVGDARQNDIIETVESRRIYGTTNEKTNSITEDSEYKDIQISHSATNGTDRHPHDRDIVVGNKYKVFTSSPDSIGCMIKDSKPGIVNGIHNIDESLSIPDSSSEIIKSIFETNSVINEANFDSCRHDLSESSINHNNNSEHPFKSPIRVSNGKIHEINSNGSEKNLYCNNLHTKDKVFTTINSSNTIHFQAGTAVFVAAGTTLGINVRKAEGEMNSVVMHRAYSGFC